MSGGNEIFTARTVWNEAQKRRERVVVAKCGKCPREAVIADTSGMARSVAFFAEKFRRKGWRIAAHRRDDTCPACVGGIKPKVPAVANIDPDKPALSPAQRRAAFCRIADVPRASASKSTASKPKGAVMPKPEPAPLTGVAPVLAIVADPPRQPGREDKHKIREALNACYLIDRECYAGDGSDKAVAEKLKVPRAWVAAEREDAYGPDACEADGRDAKALATISADLKRMGDEALDLASRFDVKHREVEALLVKLAKRGAA